MIYAFVNTVNNVKKMMQKKSQIISTDMIYGLIAFILLVTIFIGIFIYGNLTKDIDKYDYEMDYIFLNLEKNVAQLESDEIFIVGSRVYLDKLETFFNTYEEESIDELVVGQIGAANGIGLDITAYDTCLYFTDNDLSILEIDGSRYLGEVNGVACELIIESERNPCDEFTNAVSLFKPVLLDEGDVTLNRVIQMNLVVCRK